MTRPRIQRDGSLVFPRRGKPPVAVPGFEPEPGDPYVLRPVFEPCVHRQAREVVKPCGQIKGIFICQAKNSREVNPLYCMDCEERQEPACDTLTPEVLSEPAIFSSVVEQNPTVSLSDGGQEVQSATSESPSGSSLTENAQIDSASLRLTSSKESDSPLSANPSNMTTGTKEEKSTGQE